MTEPRADLIETEAAKIIEYGTHVASYAAGLDYLRFWETK